MGMKREGQESKKSEAAGPTDMKSDAVSLF